jgi:hypothetical protein
MKKNVVKKKLTEKDLTQVVKKVISEIETADSILQQEKQRRASVIVYEKLAEFQQVTRNRRLSENDIENLIEILYNEIDHLRRSLND